MAISTSTARLTFVNGISAYMRDSLLANCNSAFSLDDAVQMDAESVNEAIESDDLSMDISSLLIELVDNFPDTDIFQFIR